MVQLQSSWEERVARSLDENGISWERPKGIPWIDDLGKTHLYHPDFYLLDFDIFLDPKNDWLVVKDKDKLERVSEQNEVRIIILSEKQLEWSVIRTLF